MATLFSKSVLSELIGFRNGNCLRISSPLIIRLSFLPSSEKGIHAEVYKAYPEAGFVIHTHQKVASVISTLSEGIDKITGEAEKLIGSKVLIGSYGLPGTKKLRKGVTNALHMSPSKAVIMAHHGALCFGKDSDEAFDVANMLEDVCTDYILANAKEKLGVKADTLEEFCSKMADLLAKSKKQLKLINH